MSTSFKDTKGRTWNVDITSNTIKRVRSVLDINLADVGDAKYLTKVIDDPIALVDMLYVCLEDEMDKHDGKTITDIEFGKGMAGDCIDTATVAFLDSLVAYFPKLKRGNLENILSKMKSVQEKTHKMIDQKIEELDEAKIVEDLFQETNSTT